MEQLSNKSFKDLDDMTKEIAEKYFIAKKASFFRDTDFLAENDFFTDDSYEEFLFKVEKAYLCLSEAEQNLINNEFFYQNYHQWWKTLYSKASFYRYKKTAMERFLGAFYEE